MVRRGQGSEAGLGVSLLHVLPADEDREALQLYGRTVRCLETSKDDKEVGAD